MGFLTGKTAIITGAGRAVLQDGSCGSIGYGIATAYAKEGANLVITGRNLKKLEDAKQELEGNYGIKVLPVQADVCAGGDNEAVVANVVRQAVDALVGFRCLSTTHRHRLPEYRWHSTPRNSLIWPFTLAFMQRSII